MAEVARKNKVSEQTISTWRKHFGGLAPADAKRLKTLETENARLKKLLVRARSGHRSPEEHQPARARTVFTNVSGLLQVSRGSGQATMRSARQIPKKRCARSMAHFRLPGLPSVDRLFRHPRLELRKVRWRVGSEPGPGPTGTLSLLSFLSHGHELEQLADWDLEVGAQSIHRIHIDA